jgi:hypothetical protein
MPAGKKERGGDVMKSIIKVAFVALFCVSFVGCAVVQQSVVKSKSSYEAVWKACIDSLADVQFSASSTDMTSGIIIADQATVGGGGTVSRLNIMLAKSADGVSVTVKFVPPPMAIGGGGTADEYVKALKGRIPDIEILKTM